MGIAIAGKRISIPVFRALSFVIREHWRRLFETAALGVSQDFVEASVASRRRFAKYVTFDSGRARTAYKCRACNTHDVRVIECRRTVTRRWSYGAPAGELRYRVPVCDHCMIEAPLELTAPIIVYRAQRVDGYRDFPDSTFAFFGASYVPDLSS